MLDKHPAAFGGGANRPAVPRTQAGHPDQATRAESEMLTAAQRLPV